MPKHEEGPVRNMASGVLRLPKLLLLRLFLRYARCAKFQSGLKSTA